jgi:hypothetical protein
MQVRMIIFPGEDGLDVVIWGKWTQGSMRYRHFDDRTGMIAVLRDLRLLTSEEAEKLEDFVFTNHCPLYTAEIAEEVLVAHSFRSA